MSASKLGNSDIFRPVTIQAQTTRLNLPASAVRLRKSGIEFRTATAIPAWTEMTIDLHTPLSPKKFHGTGVVVACNGNRHAGYVISMVFTGLSSRAQAHLNSIAYSSLA